MANVGHHLRILLYVINGNDVMIWQHHGFWTRYRRKLLTVLNVYDLLELWSELSDRYDQRNGELYQIQQEITDLSQGTRDVTGYYTKLKKLKEELSNLIFKHDCTCVCTCGSKEFIFKAEQDKRLIQLLMGLNEIYTVIGGRILMMNPLPSIGKAFALLVNLPLWMPVLLVLNNSEQTMLLVIQVTLQIPFQTVLWFL